MRQRGKTEVLRYTEIRAVGQLLMHQPNPRPLGIDRRVKPAWATLDLDVPFVRTIQPGQDLPQGALARAVLTHQGVA